MQNKFHYQMLIGVFYDFGYYRAMELTNVENSDPPPEPREKDTVSLSLFGFQFLLHLPFAQRRSHIAVNMGFVNVSPDSLIGSNARGPGGSIMWAFELLPHRRVHPGVEIGVHFFRTRYKEPGDLAERVYGYSMIALCTRLTFSVW
ncbi:MAG: hypothetical protein JXR76_02150 [Deltaproteobacteria bacterium]|nr:hypothetical protein [Deltaproteobacteria bacterium]